MLIRCLTGLALLILVACRTPEQTTQGPTQTPHIIIVAPTPLPVTPTPQPTVTSTPRPINIVEPTRISATAGLGISQERIRSAFESDGFTFEPVERDDNQPRLRGASKDGQATIELVGNPDNISSAGMVLVIPEDDRTAIDRNVRHLIKFITTVAPDWNEALPFISDNLRRTEFQPVAIRKDNRELSLITAGPADNLNIVVIIKVVE